MKTRLNIIAATTLSIAVFGGTPFASGKPDLSLEPCINGGVSARGLFASQAEEDRYFDALAQRNPRSVQLAGD